MKNESRDARALHEGRRFGYQAIEDYHKRYLDKESKYFANYFTVERTCPVCSSDDSLFIFAKSGGMYHRCTRCSMIFTNPTFKPEALEKYYAELDTGQGIVVENESAFYTEIYSKGLEILMASITGSVMLDVGIPVHDLYAFALPRLTEIQIPVNVHFTKEGSRLLGIQVAEAIRSAALLAGSENG